MASGVQGFRGTGVQYCGGEYEAALLTTEKQFLEFLTFFVEGFDCGC